MSLGSQEDAAAQIDSIRLELKTWEKDFGIANDGRKPGREDIKQNPIISAKYKLYQKLQKKAAPVIPVETPRKSRTHDAYGSRRTDATPQKTPSGRRQRDNVPFETTPRRSQVEATPAFIHRALGPTPQKDGQVLGIFDIAFSATPSRSDSKLAGGENIDPTIARTPSKQTDNTTHSRLSRTPQSSSRRYLFDAFAGTPPKRKRDGEEGDIPDTGSASKRRFATPSFLRRSFPLAAIDENTLEAGSTAAPPFQKRTFVRSLSSIIQGLRKQEEERLDDEFDIMNELEDEQNGIVRQKPAAVPVMLDEEAQRAEMPLGPDQGQESEESSGSDAPGIVRKPWKKKGLKRQTRRVIMRPVLHQPKKAAELATIDEDEMAAVQETRLDGDEADSRSEDSASETGDAPDASNAKSRHNRGAAAAGDGKASESSNKKTSKPRKVSAQAHANFRKLNIKNKNSKAKGRGGRFGRR